MPCPCMCACACERDRGEGGDCLLACLYVDVMYSYISHEILTDVEC